MASASFLAVLSEPRVSLGLELKHHFIFLKFMLPETQVQYSPASPLQYLERFRFLHVRLSAPIDSVWWKGGTK
jgi:hypothetical protein